MNEIIQTGFTNWINLIIKKIWLKITIHSQIRHCFVFIERNKYS